MAAQPAAELQVRQARVKAAVNREAEPRQARRIGAAPARQETAAVPVRAAWIEADLAREATGPAAAASLPLPAAETAAHLAAPRVATAAVPLEPAAAEALPAMEEVPAAPAAVLGVLVVAVLAVAAVDGGR